MPSQSLLQHRFVHTFPAINECNNFSFEKNVASAAAVKLYCTALIITTSIKTQEPHYCRIFPESSMMYYLNFYPLTYLLTYV